MRDGMERRRGKLSNVHFARTAFARQYAFTAGRSSKLSLGDWRGRRRKGRQLTSLIRRRSYISMKHLTNPYPNHFKGMICVRHSLILSCPLVLQNQDCVTQARPSDDLRGGRPQHNGKRCSGGSGGGGVAAHALSSVMRARRDGGREGGSEGGRPE